jgi:SAM-dependent MidA family methyltransferase
VTADDRGNPRLLERIRERIRVDGPMPFDRYMELALYDPEDGYYAAGPARLGPGGDFYTASDVGHAFGRCLARQLSEMDRLLRRPEPFTYAEFGAGRGRLARDVLDALAEIEPALARRCACRLLDRSAAMRVAAGRAVPEATLHDPAEPGEPFTGCVVAVELFDALPVHRVRRRAGRLREVFVDVDATGALCEIERAPLDETAAAAGRYGAAAEEGDEAEVCTLTAAVLDTLQRPLRRGFLIVVDYGHPAAELYDERHRRGTLLAYHRHRTHEDLLARVGEQDLTAHVNFTAVADAAREAGLEVLGLTTQDRFLLANGIASEFEDPGERQRHDPARVKRRLQALQLIHPEAMGRRFRVLIASKGLEPAPRLDGLVDPFARPA